MNRGSKTFRARNTNSGSTAATGQSGEMDTVTKMHAFAPIQAKRRAFLTTGIRDDDWPDRSPTCNSGLSRLVIRIRPRYSNGLLAGSKKTFPILFFEAIQALQCQCKFLVDLFKLNR